jgi:hypothetical protein
MKDEAFASGIGRSESVKKLETHHRGTEAQRRRGEKPPLPKALSAKTLRLCVSVVGVSAFIHNLSDRS